MSKHDDKTQHDTPISIDAADRLRAASSPTRMRLFKTLSWRGPSRTSDLADELGLPRNTVSYHLQGLEKAGYISRQDGDDRRESWWSLASNAGISFNMAGDLKDVGMDLVRLDHQVIAEMVARSEDLNADGEWPNVSAGFGVRLEEGEVRELYARLADFIDDLQSRSNRQTDRSSSGPIYYLAVNFFPVQLPS